MNMGQPYLPRALRRWPIWVMRAGGLKLWPKPQEEEQGQVAGGVTLPSGQPTNR